MLWVGKTEAPYLMVKHPNVILPDLRERVISYASDLLISGPGIVSIWDIKEEAATKPRATKVGRTPNLSTGTGMGYIV